MFLQFFLFGIGISIIIYFVKKGGFFMLIFLGSMFCKKIGNTIYIPTILDMKLYYIPVQHRKSRFFILDDIDNNLSYYDHQALNFLNKYHCTLNKSVEINIFDLKDFQEKKIMVSEI